MENYFNRNDILELLVNKTKYKGLKLPAYIDFYIKNKVLSLSLSYHNTKDGIVFSCVANMQTDEAAFEGWGICLKHHLHKHIDSVVLSWDKPSEITDNQKLHYNRFLYRVIRFKEMFDWFKVADLNRKELNDFKKELTDLIINTPLSEASEPSEKGSKEKKIEYNQRNLNSIKDNFQIHCINHQLPVGVKKHGKSFFTGRASAIDIWGIDDNNNLNIYELKYKNKKVGIISELLFYSGVMYDLFVSKQIGIPAKVKEIRDAEYLYGNNSSSINAIKAHFLFDKLHPLVVGVTALLNTNNLGIKFLNVQYKLKKDSFVIDKIYYKGAFQMEEELRQTSFRNTIKIKGFGYILTDGDINLHASIRKNAKNYFRENDIDWWTFDGSRSKPTKHMVSSQIQCLNYLFAFRKDKKLTLKLAQLFDADIEDIHPTLADKDLGYIAFEFIYENEKLLNENGRGAKRGAYCTSIDAFIVATRKSEKVLIPIEWKYTENYFDCTNKALASRGGKTRQKRYNHLIENSAQLKSMPDLRNSIYYYEPFYELMRQTLLTEQIVQSGVANDFLHIVVVPSENRDLLDKNYTFSNDDLKTTWRKCLSYQSKFKIIDSNQILRLIDKEPGYSNLTNYLKSRY